MSTTIFFPGDVPVPPFFSGVGPDFPTYDICSFDDTQVKSVMLTLGRTALLGPPGNTFQALTSATHPTHWLMFVRWSGQKNAHDNGYAMMGWLKSQHSFDDAQKHITEFLKGATHTDSLVVRFQTDKENAS